MEGGSCKPRRRQVRTLPRASRWRGPGPAHTRTLTWDFGNYKKTHLSAASSVVCGNLFWSLFDGAPCRVVSAFIHDPPQHP